MRVNARRTTVPKPIRALGFLLEQHGAPKASNCPAMSHTLYATFANPEDAEKAAGALLDHGVRGEDLSVVRRDGEGYTAATAPTTTASNVVADPLAVTVSEQNPSPVGSVYGVPPDPVDRTAARVDLANGEMRDEDAEDVAKHGITTTTPGDVGAGAIKGSLVGAGIGAVAALAVLIVPGVGLVLGAGALASALGGIAATAGAGAAAGALVGYLKDMGVDDQVATEYGKTVESGGAVLAVTVPSGEVGEAEAEAVLSKYGATNVNRYASRGYAA